MARGLVGEGPHGDLRNDEAGIAFARTAMPNDDPAFLDVLAAVVRDHLAGVPA